jgi:hypothetical protein
VTFVSGLLGAVGFALLFSQAYELATGQRRPGLDRCALIALGAAMVALPLAR